MRTTIHIRRDGQKVATEYANNADDAWKVLNKYVMKFIDDEFSCEPLMEDGIMRPFWRIEFTSQLPLLCDALDQLPF